MEWSMEMVIALLILVLSLISGLLYYYVTLNYGYWKKSHIPYVEPSFPFGNILDLILAKVHMGKFYQRFYTTFKGQKYGGFYEVRDPVLILTDFDLVKQIVIKDFHHFTDRAVPPAFDHDFLMKNLFFMNKKDGWKEMRSKLTPTFTSGKMKLMYNLIEMCSEQLKNYLEPLAAEERTIEVKDIMSRFTLDIIATCAFGLEINSLANQNTEFYEISQLIFKPSKSFNLLRFFMISFPRLANFFKLTLIDPKVSMYIRNIIISAVKHREKNNIKRNDFLDLLIELRNNPTIDENSQMKMNGLTLEQIAAQAFIFFAAGFETAASTTTFVLYELTCNPEVQVKLRREVDEVSTRHGGHFDYQALQEMTFMDQVINETLRMHGSAPVLIRKCVEPYTFPDSNLQLKKGMKVVIPLYAIHNDPEIYPNPEVFDPDRFTDENIRSRHNCTFLPFGEGPRMCIGMRFGKMQVKAALATIISNFELSVTPETPIPVEVSPRIIITTPLQPIKLRISKRKN